MDVTQGAAVAVAMAVMQLLKVRDPADQLKKWYPLIALFVGFGLGFLYGFLVVKHDWLESLWDGLVTYAGAQTLWGLKEAATKPVGIKLPGDTSNIKEL